MSGIFPTGGTDPANTLLGQIGASVVAGCKALFYRSNCNPRFDPVATNAVISEIVNAINAAGIAYDCSKLNNLASALLAMHTPPEDMDNYPVLWPDGDDVMRGKFDADEGVTTVARLLRIGPNVMPSIETMAGGDMVMVGTVQSVNGEQVWYGSKISIDRLKTVFGGAFGDGYSWKDVRTSRLPYTAYRNTFASAIQLSIQGTKTADGLYVSKNGTDWLYAGTFAGNSQEKGVLQQIIPPGHYYMLNNENIQAWLELTPD